VAHRQRRARNERRSITSMQRFDVLVVGGGPAGSTTAYRLAEGGASVLLVDKARFPRDKPCGGGLTMRAVRQCPVDPAPVVEEEVDLVELRFRYGDSVVRQAREPVILMTQRRRLDAFLLDAARARGVGAWQSAGPQLREHLERLCAAHGLESDSLTELRGHRLPLRRPGTPVAGERALLVGDAAGLIDPVSGDGMYECFVSSRLAAEAILDLLAGREQSLEPYGAAVDAALAPLHRASWRPKQAIHRW